MQCRGCGAELKSDVRYCPYCGREQERQEPVRAKDEGVPQIHIHTHYDGAQPQVRVNYGTQQGNQPQVTVQYQQPNMAQPAPMVSPKSRSVALVLELLLGFLGVHRFYMGHGGLGVLYLLTGGCCGIGCIVDFFILLLGKPRDQFGREIRW